MTSRLGLTILGTLVALLIVFSSTGQIQEKSMKAYAKADLALWKEVIGDAKRVFGENSYEHAMSHYGLVYTTMATQDEDTFDEYADQTIDLLEGLIKNDHRTAEAKAVLSSIYGLKIAYDPWKAVSAGRKSRAFIEEAEEEAHDSPLVQLIIGSYRHHTPRMFGGSHSQAKAAYLRSIKLFEKEGKLNWLYLDAMARLAQIYLEKEQPDEAKRILRKCLKIMPEFTWADKTLKAL